MQRIRHFKWKKKEFHLAFYAGQTIAILSDDEGGIARFKLNERQEWEPTTPVWVFARKSPVEVAKAVLERMALRVQDVNVAHLAAIYQEAKRVHDLLEDAKRIAARRERERHIAHARATKPMLTVIRTEHDGYCHKAGEPESVILYGGAVHGEVRINMHQPVLMEPSIRIAGVGWSGWSDVSPMEAREYALAILRAADEAEAFNRREVPTDAGTTQLSK